jgi:hypothetical protein
MRHPKLTILIMAGAGITGALAQTQVDLRLQSKGVDFSAAVSTSPMKTGTVFPSVCNAGQMFFLLSGTPGSNLYACTSTNTWVLESGGGGSTSLPDFSVAVTSSTVLTIGGTCTTVAPCKARFANAVYTFVQNSQATITSGSGTAYIYLLPDGSLNVGSSLGVSCLRCTAVNGVTGFPGNSIPLASWSASSGTWVSSSGVDVRAFQSTAAVVPQLGLSSTIAAGQIILSVDTSVVGLQVGVPSTSSTACTQGSWATNGSFYYLCISTNTWARAALTSF